MHYSKKGIPRQAWSLFQPPCIHCIQHFLHGLNPEQKVGYYFVRHNPECTIRLARINDTDKVVYRVEKIFPKAFKSTDMFLGKRGRTIRDAYFLKPNRTRVQILAIEDTPKLY